MSMRLFGATAQPSSPQKPTPAPASGMEMMVMAFMGKLGIDPQKIFEFFGAVQKTVEDANARLTYLERQTDAILAELRTILAELRAMRDGDGAGTSILAGRTGDIGTTDDASIMSRGDSGGNT